MEEKIDSIENEAEEDRSYCVYIHTNKINGKKYVGQTCQWPPEKRWKGGSGYHNSTYFYRAINKYGWDNFEHEIIKRHLTLEEADSLEKYLIESLNTINPHGYNAKDGGFNGKPSEETKKKMSKAQIGKRHSEETKNKLREINTGRHHTEETKRKISESSKNKVVSQETREKLRVTNTGKHHTDESRKKMSESQKIRMSSEDERKRLGELRKGKGTGERSKEWKNNIRKGVVNAVGKSVDQYSKDGKFIKTWKCMSDVEKELKIGTSQISSCCKGYEKTAGGFIWRYVNEPITKEYIKWCNLCGNSKSVVQISKDSGDIVKVWDNISDVQKELGIDSSNISACCSGKKKSAKGYVWLYYENATEENIKNAIKQANTREPMSEETKKKIGESNKNKGIKPVEQYNKDGTFIRLWDSASEAYRELNIRHISECCKGTYKTAGGYIWRYVDRN